MATENSTWGYTRIQGALKNWGHDVARSTVATVLKHNGIAPAPDRPSSWRTFLRAHWGAIAGADLFTSEVWTPRGLITYYTLFVIDLRSRRVHVAGSIPPPDAGFIAQAARRLTDAVDGFLAGHRVLLCDRDAKWTQGFRRIVEGAGVRIVWTPVQAPNANAYTERFVRSNAIVMGIREIQSGTALEAGRVRRRGAGRKPITVHDPQLVIALDRLIEPDTLGDPESPLRGVCQSTRVLAAELGRQRHPISHVKLAHLLHQQHYRLPGTRKPRKARTIRIAQFRHINASVKKALAAGIPVLSVDTKKKEWGGNYANAGRQWRPVRQAPRVQGHDVPSPDVPRA